MIRWFPLIVALSLAACASNPPIINVPAPTINIPTLLTYAQAGIDADCAFGAGALAASVCTFGGDAIAIANSAYANDPKTGAAAVKQTLINADQTQPKIAPYVDWLIRMLP